MMTESDIHIVAATDENPNRNEPQGLLPLKQGESASLLSGVWYRVCLFKSILIRYDWQISYYFVIYTSNKFFPEVFRLFNWLRFLALLFKLMRTFFFDFMTCKIILKLMLNIKTKYFVWGATEKDNLKNNLCRVISIYFQNIYVLIFLKTLKTCINLQIDTQMKQILFIIRKYRREISNSQVIVPPLIRTFAYKWSLVSYNGKISLGNIRRKYIKIKQQEHL
uniref:Uncharacterized protein n=1 Tax=Heterorhabditis bacteriophora TaxID=37862 RepID=A0A1I7WHP8_HETBA